MLVKNTFLCFDSPRDGNRRCFSAPPVKLAAVLPCKAQGSSVIASTSASVASSACSRSQSPSDSDWSGTSGSRSGKLDVDSGPVRQPATQPAVIQDGFCGSESSNLSSRRTPLERLMDCPVDGETTLIVQHIPKTFEQGSLMKVFADLGFKNSINLLHVPCDCRKKLNLGFCMVNLATPEAAQLFQERVDGMRLESLKGSWEFR
mmetsp:Transcript_43368/g.114417  ORF Transcript_43368/g.114417 Transcript_43368/m.114417 type:complete len:204 (+) Transcript_43368:25-636(+)